MPLNLLDLIGIGDKSKDNGVLLLVSTGDREIRIEVGDGLQGRITDGKTGRILDNYVVPYLKNDDWDNGIKNGFNAILEEVCAEYDITVDGAIASVEQIDSTDETAGIVAASTFLSLFLGLILRAIFRKSKRKMTVVARKFYPFNSFRISCLE